MALLCLVSTACSTTPPISTTLFEDARGAVFLQQISDRSVRASHPISLELPVLTRILSGILIQERQQALQSVLAGPSPTVPVFSAEEIKFLVPLLAKALATAAEDQTAGFSLTTRHPGRSLLESSTTETTAGSLYASDRSLYFLLSHYRSAPARTNTENIAHRRLPDRSGLSDRLLFFTPHFAQGSDSSHRSTSDATTDKVLVIDYQLLQQEPPTATIPVQHTAQPEHVVEPPRQTLPTVPPSPTPSSAQQTPDRREDEVHALKDLIIKKDLELEALKQELQSIRQQLDDQITSQERQKRKSKPPSKVPHTTP